MSDQKDTNIVPQLSAEEKEQLDTKFKISNPYSKPKIPLPISRLIQKHQQNIDDTPLTNYHSIVKTQTTNKKSRFLFDKPSPAPNRNYIKTEVNLFQEEEKVKENPLDEEDDKDKRCMIDFHVKSNRAQLPNLINVYVVLLKVFFNLPIKPEELELKQSKLYLIKEIILRKSKHPSKFASISQKTSNVTVQDVMEILEYLDQFNSTKRVEENIKFIFKLTLKRLKKDYQIQKANSINDKKESLNDFFTFYFKEFVDMWGLDIMIFTEPLRKKIYQKKLNHEYIKRIFAAKSFKTDFLKHINSGEFKREYQGTIPNKVFKLLSRFDRLFANEDEQATVEVVHKYFKRNKQCKLPWTEKEINNSIIDFNALCNRLGI